MNLRRLKIFKYAAIGAAVMVLAWCASAIAVYAASSRRVFDSASIDAVPHQRAAVVMVFSFFLENNQSIYLFHL